MDDVIAIVTKETGKKLLQHLNSQHPRIKFTLDEEEARCLPFIDVSFTHQLDGSLTRQMYQKATHTNRYVLFSSHHPTNVKEGIVRGLADCAIKVCNDGETLDRELKCIATAMEGNGYPKQFTENAISRPVRATSGGKT